MENLKTLQGKKAVLVLGGGSMKRFGFVDKAVAYLKEAGIETKLFENVEPDPSVETDIISAFFCRNIFTKPLFLRGRYVLLWSLKSKKTVLTPLFLTALSLQKKADIISVFITVRNKIRFS